MHRNTVLSSQLAPVYLAASTVLLAACSAPASDADIPSSTSEAAIKTPANTDETARIKKFLDDRYTDKDVRYSFETKFGETIDCVDFLAQPGAKKLAARGTPIVKERPKPPGNRAAIDPSSLPDFMFNGTPDKYGRPRSCPEGAVPLLRVTSDHVRAAGGLDAFERAHSRKQRPPLPSTSLIAPSSVPPDGAGPTYAHVYETFAGGSTIVDGVTTTSIFAPTVLGSNYFHNISQTWAISSDGLQTVEVGWNVDPYINAGNNPNSAHLFIFATTDGYGNGCYNDVGSNCVPWVAQSGAVVTPGMTLPNGTPGGTQHELTLYTLNYSAGWYIYGAIDSSGGYLGYYPTADFSGTMQTSAGVFQVGGEVSDVTEAWVVPMGSGSTPTAGYGQAAYHHDFYASTPSGGWSTNFTVNGSTIPSAYAISTTTAAGGSWANYFYYGDAPAVFWGQNYGYGWSPIGDWISGSYKGECGLGQPITGLSKNTGGSNEAHALLCGSATISTTGSSCYARTFDPGNNQGYTDNGWDWDWGYYKAECGVSEFVQGIAQSTSGAVDAILCCPGSVSHSSCNVQVFYSDNSSGFSANGTDWDDYYYKGQCPSGQYVAGVSAVAWTSNGVVGAPHAILCCSP